jgi:hypothetical protein
MGKKNHCAYEGDECKSVQRNEQQKSIAKDVVRCIRENNCLIYTISLF